MAWNKKEEMRKMEADIKMKNSTKHRSHADGGKCGG